MIIIDILCFVNIEYWFEHYKWFLAVITFLFLVISLNKGHSRNINGNREDKKSESESDASIQPKSIGEALLLHQQKTTADIHEKNKELHEKQNEKVKKFRFSTQELHQIKEKPAKKEENEVVDNSEIILSFELLQDFDIILPKIRGTYDDFLEAVEKFCGIFTETKQLKFKQIQALLHQKKYRDIILLIQKCIEEHEQPFALKKNKFYKWLQYGGFLEIADQTEPVSFVIDYHNIQLCEEINQLIQQLLVKYYCNKNSVDFEKIDQLIEEVDLEELDLIKFTTTYSEIGENISKLLVQDFFSMLHSKKKEYSIKYRSLRLIFGNDNEDSYKVGKLVWLAIEDIKRIHQNILEKIALSTSEIQQLISQGNTSKNLMSAPKKKYTDEELELEQVLRSIILIIIDFFNWFPQDQATISEEDVELVNYFDKLLYSRKSRFEIVRDKDQKNMGKAFSQNISKVTRQLDYAERVIDKITIDKLIGAEAHIAVPRQCEDYFPIKGTIFNIYKDETDVGNIIKLEVTEKNNLRSSVIFTGNNIHFVY